MRKSEGSLLENCLLLKKEQCCGLGLGEKEEGIKEKRLHRHRKQRGDLVIPRGKAGGEM